MFKFFDIVLGYVERLFDFLVNIIKSFGTALGIVATSSSTALSLLGYVPAIIGASISVVLAISVVKFIIGR